MRQSTQIFGLKGSKKVAFGAAVIGLIAGLIIIGVIGWGGEGIKPFSPPPAPAEYSVGHAIINFWDPFTQEPVDDVQLYIQFQNGSNYLNTTSGASFYISGGSWFFAVKTGYWNVSGTVFAGGDTSNDTYIQTHSLTRIASKAHVHISITAIDGIFGIYNSSDIGNGFHTLTFSYIISGGWYENSSWGVSSWVPEIFIPIGSHAALTNISTAGLWIGWNGSITDYSLGSSPVGYFTVHNIGNYNSTHFYGIAFSGELQVSGVFNDITNAIFYFGLMDAITSWTIPF